MPNFQISIPNNLPSAVPSNQQVIYTLDNGAVQQWWVQAYRPNPLANTATPIVVCGTDLVNVPNVSTRTLRMHYPSAPHTVDHQILSVIRA